MLNAREEQRAAEPMVLLTDRYPFALDALLDASRLVHPLAV